mgnify:CR=1 FL=1
MFSKHVLSSPLAKKRQCILPDGCRCDPYRSLSKLLNENLVCVQIARYIHTISEAGAALMRTNIVIDDDLMDEVLGVTGRSTKREAVELGLRTLLKLKKQQGIRQFRGRLRWQGDLNSMRKRW